MAVPAVHHSVNPFQEVRGRSGELCQHRALLSACDLESFALRLLQFPCVQLDAETWEGQMTADQSCRRGVLLRPTDVSGGQLRVRLEVRGPGVRLRKERLSHGAKGRAAAHLHVPSDM